MTEPRKPGYDPSTAATQPAGQRAISATEAVDAVAPPWFKLYASDASSKLDAIATNQKLANLETHNLALRVGALELSRTSIPPGAMLGAPVSMGAQDLYVPARPPATSSTNETDDGRDESEDDQDSRLQAHSGQLMSVADRLAALEKSQQRGRTRASSALSRQTKQNIATTFLAALSSILGTWATTRQSAKDGAAAGAAEAIHDAPKAQPVNVNITPTPVHSGAY